MPPRLPFVHIAHLITELRRTAEENVEQALADSDGGLELCLAAALMQDAADALGTLLQERTANDPQGKATSYADRRRNDGANSFPGPKSGILDSIRIGSDPEA